MVLISKHDKKVWKNYVSNFENFVVVTQKNDLTNLKNNNKNLRPINKDKSSNFSRLIKKGRFKPDAVLDLHGYTLYSAKLILNKYIINCYEKNIRNILLITGKGQQNKGVLKEELPKMLNDKSLHNYLVDFNIAPKQFGGEGALLIRIRNKFKNSNL